MGYRLNGHIRNACTGGNTKFAFAIRKYGIDSFTSEVLIEVENCKLNEQEIFFIDMYDSYRNGYNCTLGGGSTGHEQSPGTKHNMSMSTKKWWDDMTAEQRETHRVNTAKGVTESWKNMTTEQYEIRCNNISSSLKGRIEPEWKKEAHSKRMSGKGNSKAKHISIYNSDDAIMFECEGNFKVICDDNNLPHNSLRNSHVNNGERIFQTKRGLSTAKRRHWELYVGWYAKEMVD
jgi:group I intron endonuclease